MQPGFDVFDYAGYVLHRWRFFLACCAVAAGLAAMVSFLLPRRYTATATVLINPPAGNDPQSSTAVSPVYLESLKTYERLADSDSLFLAAIQKFSLRGSEGTAPADKLKAGVLKVTKPPNTRMLQIQVTLRDPVKARDVARFIAESTAEMSRSLGRQTEDEFRRETRDNTEAARKRVGEADKALAAESLQPSPESLRAELDATLDLKNRIRRDLLDTEAEAAGQNASHEPRRFGPGAAELSARRDMLRKQLDSLDVEIHQREAGLSRRQASLARLESERKSARAVSDDAESRLNDALASAGSRGERLTVVDPGTVPERPSSPSTLLNILGALLISFTAALLYLSISFAHRRQTAAREFRESYPTVR